MFIVTSDSDSNVFVSVFDTKTGIQYTLQRYSKHRIELLVDRPADTIDTMLHMFNIEAIEFIGELYRVIEKKLSARCKVCLVDGIHLAKEYYANTKNTES